MTPTSSTQTTNANEFVFLWEAKDKTGRLIQGELRATGIDRVNLQLCRQGLTQISIKKKPSLMYEANVSRNVSHGGDQSDTSDNMA